MTTHIIAIRGKQVDLGVMQKEYLPQMTAILNDTRVTKFILARPPLTPGQEEEFLERIEKSSSDHVFAILKKTGDSHEYIGHTGIKIESHRNAVGTTGTVMKFDELENGYGTEAKHLALFYAFRQLGLRKIRSSVLSINPRSQRFLEKTGHRIVGRYTNEFLRDGQLCDEILVELTYEDWCAAWETYKETHGMEDPF